MDAKSLGPLPERHPREKTVERAAIVMDANLSNVAVEFDLTSSEFVMLITQYLSKLSERYVQIERRKDKDNGR